MAPDDSLPTCRWRKNGQRVAIDPGPQPVGTVSTSRGPSPRKNCQSAEACSIRQLFPGRRSCSQGDEHVTRSILRNAGRYKMKITAKTTAAALLATGLFAFSSAAMATNGYFTHGVGTESKAMGGSGVGSSENMGGHFGRNESGTWCLRGREVAGWPVDLQPDAFVHCLRQFPRGSLRVRSR